LAKLTEIETEEMSNNMNDFVPIRYSQHDQQTTEDGGDDDDDDNYTHSNTTTTVIDTIEEIATCPIHGDTSEEEYTEKQQPVVVVAAAQIDINENFIKVEREALQAQMEQQPRGVSPSRMLLMKQAHVDSSDFPEETTSDLVLINEDIITPTTKAAVIEDGMLIAHKVSAAVVENFPKTNEISNNDEEIPTTISPFEHAIAKCLENESLKVPIIEPDTTIIKSPTKEEEEIFTENTSEMPTEHLPTPTTVKIVDDATIRESDLNQASAALENVEY
jgi:hypothetical protein